MVDTLEGPLDEAGIALAPASHGAYCLLHAGRVVFVGATSGTRTLRGELRRHWRGDFGPRTQGASHFECAVAPGPADVHALYLALYGASGLRDAAPRLRI